jgi:hypothetical protein
MSSIYAGSMQALYTKARTLGGLVPQACRRSSACHLAQAFGSCRAAGRVKPRSEPVPEGSAAVGGLALATPLGNVTLRNGPNYAYNLTIVRVPLVY